MDSSTIVEVRKIDINKEYVLEVQMTQAFIDRLRQHFGLLEKQSLDDDHVRTYFLEAVNTAVTKAENEVKHEEIQRSEEPKKVRKPRRRKKDAGG